MILKLLLHVLLGDFEALDFVLVYFASILVVVDDAFLDLELVDQCLVLLVLALELLEDLLLSLFISLLFLLLVLQLPYFLFPYPQLIDKTSQFHLEFILI